MYPSLLLIVTLFSATTYAQQNISHLPALMNLENERILIVEKIKKPFTKKLDQATKQLEASTKKAMQEPLYNEIQTALSYVKNEKSYKFYLELFEMLSFSDQLYTYNSYTNPTPLLNRINGYIDQIKDYESLSALRSTLKKERVALIEILEEKDFIATLQNQLANQKLTLFMQLETLQKALRETASYQNLKEVQNRYLQSSSIKKCLSCIEKVQNIALQQDMAILKNKEHQKITRKMLLIDTHAPHVVGYIPSYTTLTLTTSDMVVNCQRVLFLCPITEFV